MKLDKTLAKEIKACNGDGSREAKFATLKKIDAAVKDMSTPQIRDTFNDCLCKHGRAIVAICIAATLYDRRERIDGYAIKWALCVLDLWTNQAPSNISRAIINDGLHPTRIHEYAGSFIESTSE